MKISIVLDTKRTLSDGKYPIKIRLYENAKEIFINTGFYADATHFDKESGLLYGMIGRQKSEMLATNSKLLSILDEVKDLYADFEKKGQDITPSRLKSVYTKGNHKQIFTLNDCFKQFIKTKTGRTAEIYQATLNKIEKYYGTTIYFDDVNFNWLESLDAKLKIEPIVRKKKIKDKVEDKIIKRGLDTNARSIHFRNIRAVFNYAIDNEYISQNLYPFRRFKIKAEETAKRSIEVENLRDVFAFEGTNSQNWARDIAILVFSLIGINVKDLYSLETIKSKEIVYKRAKTKRVYTITIEPEAKAIIDKYRGEKGFIFKEQLELNSFGDKVNKHLKGISNTLGIDNITTYSLRHSWATIAAELEIPKETIGAALGHSDKSITNVYINFNQKKIDDANRKVLDYVFQRGEYAPKIEDKIKAPQ